MNTLLPESYFERLLIVWQKELDDQIIYIKQHQKRINTACCTIIGRYLEDDFDVIKRTFSNKLNDAVIRNYLHPPVGQTLISQQCTNRVFHLKFHAQSSSDRRQCGIASVISVHTFVFFFSHSSTPLKQKTGTVVAVWQPGGS